MTVDEMGRCLTRLKGVLTQWAPKEIDKDLATMWLSILKEYSDMEIKVAFSKAASTLIEWPAPAQIKRLCQGTFKSDEELGQEVASRIEGAIRSYGYPSPDRAEKFIGPLGWEVVRQCGGWSAVCELENDQLASSRRQWRETATILSKNFYVMGENSAPKLPDDKQTATLHLVANGRQF